VLKEQFGTARRKLQPADFSLRKFQQADFSQTADFYLYYSSVIFQF